MDLEKIRHMMPDRIFQRRVRKAAIKRVRKDLVLHGKKEEDFSKDDLEYLVSDAESDVINDLQKAGLIGVLAILGFGF